ncbi:MAG: DNA recombination protein RmuC [Ferrimicrobium sp.]
MQLTTEIGALVLGIVIGAIAITWRHAAREPEYRACERERDDLRTQIKQLEQTNSAREIELARFQERLNLASTTKDEVKNALDLNKQTLEATLLNVFASQTNQMTARASTAFAEKAEQSYERLVKPIDQRLANLDTQLRAMESFRTEEFGGLRSSLTELMQTHIPALRSETNNLVKALRQPSTRGAWGEIQLRRVIELSGMINYCDFDEQPTFNDDTGRSRPDVVVRLPGDRCIIIDAKVPMDAFLTMTEAVADEDVLRARKRHAEQLNIMIADLSSRKYGDRFKNSLDFVVLFLPGEAFLSEALAVDPAIVERAMANSVVVASPTTLLPLLKAVAFGWRSDTLEQNARLIADLGKDIYTRLTTFRGHLAKVGSGLTTAVNAYNDGVGSLESRVLPKARQLRDHGVTGAEDALDPVPSVDLSLRSLKHDE